MAERAAIFPAGVGDLYAINRYSPGVRSGDLLFVSGQVGSRADGSPEPNFERQVRLAFENLAAILAAADCTFDDVIDVTTYQGDPETQFDTVKKVREQFIGNPPYPTWTAVGARLLYGFDFEIKAVARIARRAAAAEAAFNLHQGHSGS